MTKEELLRIAEVLQSQAYESDYVRVIAVYRKFRTDKCFEESTYVAKNVDLAEIEFPNNYIHKVILPQ
jgi:hypothetical protein